MEETPSGMVICVKEVQFANACLPILLTLAGSDMDTNDQQLTKEVLPMAVTVLGI